MKKNIKCMKDMDLFQPLNDMEKQKILKLAQGKNYLKDEIVFSEGEKSDTIYLIRSGRILLFKVSEDGKKIILDILEEGDIIGENTIFDDLCHTFSAKAIEDAFVCRCFKSDFSNLLSNPDISIKIIKSLTDKLNNYTDTMVTMAFCDVKNRVLTMLMRLGKKYGSNTPEGIKLDIYLSHEDIAHLTNASRVMVTNTIKALKAEGKILVHKRHYIIKDESLVKWNITNL
ncbi:Crp/Fnr family transcriptional regulator [Geosporobacter ferrireducens]|uniref:CarD family transcriptional regulator n=1 Tax=Geosporobacter ferrireducens TaxID=1424294 RepID=A0A1D8GNL4_9FIRM|nr:Crp/Fnr family transcriptional regulator [Geosporobacter ferrireducens]AOT72518.1 CarD family transcriptional regulator [Geosporobacter ferrireducens]MTI58184.1 Crp/Fnr family transcriptional regulator [Geosporobacter ferrireducens]